MAPILCQAIYQAESLTFVWSQGDAFFEPYRLQGADYARFSELAASARQGLAEMLASENAGMAAELASMGRGVHDLVFQGATGQKVQAWLQRQPVENLEILSNAPERMPWNLVYDRDPSADLQGFWGMRYALTQGARASSLRVRPYIQEPAYLVALDPQWEPESQGKARLAAFAPAGEVQTLAELLAKIDKQSPDFLVLAGRVDDRHFWLGEECIDLADLSHRLANSQSGSLFPIVLLAGEARAAGQWQPLLAHALAHLPGLLAFETTASGSTNLDAVLTTLEQLGQRLPMGEVLRKVRNQLGYLGLGWNGYCPSTVRIVQGEENLEPTGMAFYPLPDSPFHPLRPLDREQRSLLVGREHDIDLLGKMLDRADVRGLLLHGRGGVGKASLLRSGLLPHLEEGPSYLVLRDRTQAANSEMELPTLALRATHDLPGQLAEAVTLFCARPYAFTTPEGETVVLDLPALLQEIAGSTSLESVWQFFTEHPLAFGNLWQRITDALPRELVLTIEQAEDLLSVPKRPRDQRRLQVGLEMLSSLPPSARGKVILSMRTELFGQWRDQISLGRGDAWREYYLDDLPASVLEQILALPGLTQIISYANQIPGSRYRVTFDPKAISEMVKQVRIAAQEQGVTRLSLLLPAASLLAEQAGRANPPQVTVRQVWKFDFDQAISDLVEARGKAIGLKKSNRKQLQNILSSLIISPNGVPVRTLATVDAIRPFWRGPQTVESLLQSASAAPAELLQLQSLFIDGKYGTYVSLPQESLARLPLENRIEWKKRDYGLARIIDSLFIFLPLMALVGAMTYFYFTRRVIPPMQREMADVLKKKDREIKESTESAAALTTFVHKNGLQLAEQALRQKDILKARQLLLGYQPTNEAFDDRGFEWHYLWKRIHPEKAVLQGQSEPAQIVAITQAGDKAAVADSLGVIRLWTLEPTPQVGAVLKGPEGTLSALAFSNDGKWLASAGGSGLIQLWNTEVAEEAPLRSDRPVKTFKSHEARVKSLAFSPDDKTLLSGGGDRLAVFWDVEKAKEKFSLKEFTDGVVSVAISPDGKLFAVAAGMSAWQGGVADGKKVKDFTLSKPGVIQAVAFVDDQTLAVASTETDATRERGRIDFWAFGDAKTNADSIALTHRPVTLTALPEKNMILVSGTDRAIHVFDAKTHQEADAILGHLGWVRSLAVAEKAGTLVTAAFENEVKVIDLAEALAPQSVLAHAGGVSTLAFAPQRMLLASGGRDGVVQFWHPETGRVHGEMKLAGTVSALEFAEMNDEILLATGTWSEKDRGELKLWKINLGKKGIEAEAWKTLGESLTGVRGLAFDPLGKELAALGSETRVHRWDLATGKSLEPLKVPDSFKYGLHSLAYSPSGDEIEAGNAKGDVLVWNLESGKIDKILANLHGSAVRGLVPQKDGKLGLRILSIGDDHRLSRVVRQPLALLSAHRLGEAATSLAAFGERLVVVGDALGRVHFFDQHFDRENLTMQAHVGGVRAVAISPDQKIVVSGGDDGMLRIYRGDWAKLPPTPRDGSAAKEKEED